MKEIMLIKTAEAEKIKSVLKREHINYQLVYDDILYEKDLTEEEIWHRDILLANKDEARNREIAAWNKISKVKDKQGW